MTKQEKNPIIVGLDHGNGWVKVKTATNQVVLPSYIARKDSIGEGITGKSLDIKEYESGNAKGEVFIWGNDVVKSEKLLSTYGSQDRYKQKYYSLLNEFALTEVLSDLEMDVLENVWVITGVPSEEKGTSVEEDLEKSLMGAHLIKVNGEDKIIKVSKVVILPQPVGTVMSLYLDEKGYVANEAYETDSVGIIDLGTGTSDLDHINELRRNEDDSLSIPLGMFDVYKRIEKYIKKQNPNADVTPQKVEAQFSSDSYVISKRAAVDITEVKEKALEEVAMDIKNAITQQWKTWDRFDSIIITGGGASTLGRKLKQLIDDAAPVKESQTANATGFYRYGEFLKGE
ncbi:plasmid segregation protein ParM [Bacillus infantis]|uniref:ParM/StbA family protein n=1 Tax=Bacillus infantis TaxID=324767 RepID=UPI002FBE5A04